MKKILVLLLIMLISIPLLAEDEKEKSLWENKGQTSFQFAQAAFKNWAGGGTNALSLNTLLTYYVSYKRDKFSWKNNFEVGYGFQYALQTMQKTDDKLDYSTSLDFTAGKSWDYSGALSFKTQMVKGYDSGNLISNFFAPAYVVISGGMTFAPNEDLNILLAPVTGKMTFVTDPVLSAAGSYGVDPGKTLRAELGGFIKMSLKYELLENVLMRTKLELFSNYADNPQFVDVNWDLLIAMKINKYLSANISTNLIYDHDIDIKHENLQGVTVTGPAVQFKEMFSLGVTFIL